MPRREDWYAAQIAAVFSDGNINSKILKFQRKQDQKIEIDEEVQASWGVKAWEMKTGAKATGKRLSRKEAQARRKQWRDEFLAKLNRRD